MEYSFGKGLIVGIVGGLLSLEFGLVAVIVSIVMVLTITLLVKRI